MLKVEVPVVKKKKSINIPSKYALGKKSISKNRKMRIIKTREDK